MANKPESKVIVQQFDRERSLYDEYSRRIKVLVEDLLRSQDLSIHSVTARIKDTSSLEEKIQNREPPYQTLEQITDIAGVRIITHFPDDVDRVGEIIEAEFEVDSVNSVDKRDALDPDRFGYLSLHYVISLSGGRSCLGEYKPYKGKKCEIQVRSVLQHAWAEIEHDLGYKAAGGVPRDVRRRFSRVAGLLELADLEFQGIRQDLVRYANELPQRMQKAPATVLLDAVSLAAFIKDDAAVAELDKKITKIFEIHELLDEPRPDLSTGFHVLGVTTIEQLRSALQSRREKIPSFAHTFLKDTPKPPFVRKGISLLHLRNVMLAETGDVDTAAKIFTDIDREALKKTIQSMATIYKTLT